MREMKTREIGGVGYSCTMMPALKAHALFVELTQLIGVPAMSVISAAFEKRPGDVIENDEDESPHVETLLARGIQIFLAELTPKQANRIILTAMDGVRCGKTGDPDNKPLQLHEEDAFNAHFKGRTLDIYRVFSFALECNYRDFFDSARSSGLLRAISSRIKAVGDAAASSLQTSPGASGS